MARTQSGTIAFVGSGEFLPPFAPVDLDAVSASMPPMLIGAGVDGSTALVGQGQIWTVLGRGGVTLFTPSVRRRYRTGETVTLPLTTV